jgi:hypothetical protein
MGDGHPIAVCYQGSSGIGFFVGAIIGR